MSGRARGLRPLEERDAEILRLWARGYTVGRLMTRFDRSRDAIRAAIRRAAKQEGFDVEALTFDELRKAVRERTGGGS